MLAWDWHTGQFRGKVFLFCLLGTNCWKIHKVITFAILAPISEAYPQVFDSPPGLELPWTQMPQMPKIPLEAMEDPRGPITPIGPMGPMGPVLPRPCPAAPSLGYCEAQNFCQAKRGISEKIEGIRRKVDTS